MGSFRSLDTRVGTRRYPCTSTMERIVCCSRWTSMTTPVGRSRVSWFLSTEGRLVVSPFHPHCTFSFLPPGLQTFSYHFILTLFPFGIYHLRPSTLPIPRHPYCYHVVSSCCLTYRIHDCSASLAIHSLLGEVKIQKPTRLSHPILSRFSQLIVVESQLQPVRPSC